jgi:hypothetical protein
MVGVNVGVLVRLVVGVLEGTPVGESQMVSLLVKSWGSIGSMALKSKALLFES